MWLELMILSPRVAWSTAMGSENALVAFISGNRRMDLFWVFCFDSRATFHYASTCLKGSSLPSSDMIFIIKKLKICKI